MTESQKSDFSNLNFTLTLIRHSKANKAAEGEGDRTRRLSDEGVLLAQRRRDSLDRYWYDLAISSDRVRAIETRDIVTNRTSMNAEASAYVEIPRLYTHEDPANEKIVDGLYGRIGSTPLGNMLNQATRVEAQVLEEFSRDSWNLIMQEVLRTNASTVLVASHEIYSQSMLWEASNRNPEFAGILLDRAWNVCDGAHVTILDGQIYSMERLPSVVE